MPNHGGRRIGSGARVASPRYFDLGPEGSETRRQLAELIIWLGERQPRISGRDVMRGLIAQAHASEAEKRELAAEAAGE